MRILGCAILLTVLVNPAAAQTGDAAAQDQPAYIVAAVTINDLDTYRQYQAGFRAILERYLGELVAISGDPTILEGEWSATLTVLLRFASREQALEWYNSGEYQELVQIRHASSTADLILIDGRR